MAVGSNNPEGLSEIEEMTALKMVLPMIYTVMGLKNAHIVIIYISREDKYGVISQEEGAEILSPLIDIFCKKDTTEERICPEKETYEDNSLVSFLAWKSLARNAN
jgi:hypothetical protein